MRYMGIDYGTKRVGVAFSDEGGRMAFPHGVLRNDAELAHALAALALREKVGAIVIGKSHNLAGEDNPVHVLAQACGQELESLLSVPVYFESEVYSTQEALRAQGRTPLTDASAAAIILNSFLERHSRS